jgi:hypothetical protein
MKITNYLENYVKENRTQFKLVRMQWVGDGVAWWGIELPRSVWFWKSYLACLFLSVHSWEIQMTPVPPA